jgi:uncharacterized membrane protein (DUF4010 family)
MTSVGPLLPYRDLAAALAIGLLIGIERGWKLRQEPEGSRVAGFRTFGLLGLLGGLAGLIGKQQPLLAAVLALGALAILILDYRHAETTIQKTDVSSTTEIAALLTFALGALATGGYPIPALAAAAIATALLAQREMLHGWLRGMTEVDIRAVVRFAIIAGVIWPLLPNRDMGPFNAWNPFDLWLVVVIVCGFSFAGYIAGRRLGATRGTLATAAIGGIYSSTAVTAALSQRIRAEPGQAAIFAAGIAVASAVMFGRVLVLTAILVPFALPRLAMIIVPAGVVAMAFVAWQWRSAQGTPATEAKLPGNPFALLPALGFAALVAGLALAVRWAQIRFGDAGIATLLAITGAMDVDAAIVTMRGLPPAALDADVAGMILSLPVLLNTLFKAVIVVATAGWKAGWRAALPLLASAAVIPVALLLTRHI